MPCHHLAQRAAVLVRGLTEKLLIGRELPTIWILRYLSNKQVSYMQCYTLITNEGKEVWADSSKWEQHVQLYEVEKNSEVLNIKPTSPPNMTFCLFVSRLLMRSINQFQLGSPNQSQQMQLNYLSEFLLDISTSHFKTAVLESYIL